MSRRDLTVAIRENDLNKVQQLLDASPSLLEELVPGTNTVRYSPFVEAIIYKRVNIARYLASRGADVHRRFDAAEEQGFTVAHWAVLNCSPDVLRFLMELEVDFKAVTSRNTSPLSKSASIRNISALKFLLEELELDPRTKSFQGDSLLHIAAFNGNVPAFHYLTRQHGLDMYEENMYHLTPVFQAAAGSVELLTELVSHGVDYLSMVNSNHNCCNYAMWTPLHYACERGNVSTFNYLAKELKLNVEALTHYGSNCLLVAAGSSLDLVKLLLSEYHQDPHLVNGFGENAVFVASKHGKIDVVEYLYETTGVDVSLKNRDGMGILDIVKGKKWEMDVRKIVLRIQETVWRKRKWHLALRLRLKRLQLR